MMPRTIREQKMLRLENNVRNVLLHPNWYSFHELIDAIHRVMQPTDGLTWSDVEEVLDRVFPDGIGVNNETTSHSPDPH